MRTSIFLLLIIGTLNSWAQVITDRLTPERDKIFHELKCGTTELSLKRVLKVGESASIRKGRELLVAIDEQGNFIYEFENIDNYSSLFFEVAKFNVHDINSDGTKELIIEIEPLESSNSIWIYEQTTECKLIFLGSYLVNNYEIRNNTLILESNILCEYWDECMVLASYPEQVEYDRLKRLDYFKIENSELLEINSEHSEEINKLIADYREVVSQLNELETQLQTDWEKKEISEMSELLAKRIKEYSPVTNN